MRSTVQGPRGRVRAHRVDPLRAVVRGGVLGYEGEMYYGLPVGWTPITPFRSNTVLYEWGAIVGKLLLKQGLQYGIGGMYIEFENVADPDDPVAAPTVERDPEMGVEYYDGLALSSDRDYLRVPLIAGTLNSSDDDDFPKGNEPTFFAQTSGLTGVHGKTFSDSSNSKVFGAALVAFPNEDDPTQDLVFARFYFDVEDQQVKLATSQIGIEWPITLN